MRVLRAVWERIRGRYYARPSAYWDRRHARHGLGLDGIGCCGLGEEGNSADYAAKWDHIRPALCSVIAPGATVLDAGCGTGWFARRLAGLGFVVDAVDFSEVAVGKAREAVAGIRNWHVGDLALFEPGGRYEAVMCIDVLFHVTDDGKWKGILGNLAGLVEDEGVLLVQEHLLPRAERSEAARGGTTHVRWRCREDYEEALKGWRLLLHHAYQLPRSGARKDLLAFRRLPRVQRA